MKPILLKLKAKHFKDSEFYSDDCPIGRAIKELLNRDKLRISFAYVWFDDAFFAPDSEDGYKFPFYSSNDFNQDKELASESVYNKIIRVIELTKI